VPRNKWWLLALGLIVVVPSLAVLIIVAAHYTKTLADGVSVVAGILGVAAILTGALVTVFLLDGFTPRLNVRLTPRLENDDMLVVGVHADRPY
jgi:hypothetical protein